MKIIVFLFIILSAISITACGQTNTQKTAQKLTQKKQYDGYRQTNQ